jgi:hypothetical protein
MDAPPDLSRGPPHFGDASESFAAAHPRFSGTPPLRRAQSARRDRDSRDAVVPERPAPPVRAAYLRPVDPSGVDGAFASKRYRLRLSDASFTAAKP